MGDNSGRAVRILDGGNLDDAMTEQEIRQRLNEISEEQSRLLIELAKIQEDADKK